MKIPSCRCDWRCFLFHLFVALAVDTRGGTFAFERLRDGRESRVVETGDSHVVNHCGIVSLNCRRLQLVSALRGDV